MVIDLETGIVMDINMLTIIVVFIVALIVKQTMIIFSLKPQPKNNTIQQS